MASDLSFVQYVVDQARKSVALTYRKMFGEYAVYANGKTIALVCDNSLYLKPTAAGRALLETMSGAHERAPFPGAKMWFVIDDELDNPERLGEILRVTEKNVPAKVVRTKRPSAAKKSRTRQRPEA